MDTAVYNEALCIYQTFQRDIGSVVNLTEFSKILKRINGIFLQQSSINQEVSPGEVNKLIQDRFYGDICNVILDSFSNSWLKDVNSNTEEEVNELFLNGPMKEVLFTLVGKFHEKGCHSYVLKEAKRLLALLVPSQRFPEILSKECDVTSPSTGLGKSNTPRNVYDESLLTILCSLPDRVANKLGLERHSVLHPFKYFSTLTECLCVAMEYVHTRLSTGKDSSMLFLSRLFAKICALNHANTVYDILLPRIEEWIKISPLWSRICSYLFIKCPELNLEFVLEPLLKREIQVSTLATLIGNDVPSNSKIRFLLTHKYLFVRVYENDLVPVNIFSYLNHISGKGVLLMDIFIRLLEVWGDKHSLTSTSVDQHYYISRCISSLSSFLRDAGIKEKKSIIMKCLLNGMSVHLESPIEQVRLIGMTIGEIITKKLDDKETSLRFDFNRDEESQYLEKLSIDPYEAIHKASNNDNIESIVESEPVSEKGIIAGNQENNVGTKEIDSDDDFEPYNMDESDDGITVNGIQPPLYVRDCIYGLLSKDDPNRLEASLKVAEKLIWKESNDLEDIAVEITKILLYLDDQYGLTGFIELRFNSLVAICCRCPKTVSSYLTKEFYAENYNIRQRLDILEVLCTSASFLSTPGKLEFAPKKEGLLLPNIMSQKAASKNDWKVIIEERLKKKTRIFSKGKQQMIKPSQNQFSDCAGYFFFPLLKHYDSSKLTFDLHGQDSFLLGRLVYAAGSILHCSSGLLIVNQMAMCSFEIIWGLRFHKEPFVRQSLIYLFCMVLVSCNPSTFLSDFSKELFEGKEWLEDVLKVDADKECQKLAAHCLVILESTFKTAMVQ